MVRLHLGPVFPSPRGSAAAVVYSCVQLHFCTTAPRPQQDSSHSCDSDKAWIYVLWLPLTSSATASCLLAMSDPIPDTSLSVSAAASSGCIPECPQP